MKVKEFLEKLIERDKKIYGNRYERNGIIYKELSDRFPNGKKILCEVERFIEEFGEMNMDDNRTGNFKWTDVRYQIITFVNYEKEKSKMIEETPIIVGKNYTIEMKEYKRKLEKGFLLRGTFEGDYKEWSIVE